MYLAPVSEFNKDHLIEVCAEAIVRINKYLKHVHSFDTVKELNSQKRVFSQRMKFYKQFYNKGNAQKISSP